MRVGIVGGGISGLSCASTLRAAGHVVTVFEAARVPGGRTTSKKLGAARFDAGAPWFQVRSEAFRDVVRQWQERGLVAEYRPTWSGRPAAARETVFVGTPGMNSVARELASEGELKWDSIVRAVSATSVETAKGERFEFDRVVVATALSDARRLLTGSGAVGDRLDASASPLWSVTLEWGAAPAVAFGAMELQGPLGLVVHENSKPEREPGELWTAYASPEWSKTQTLASDVTKVLSALAAKALGRELPVNARAYKWDDAFVEQYVGEPFVEVGGVLVCGDYLHEGGVEGAWASGEAAAAAALRGNAPKRGR